MKRMMCHLLYSAAVVFFFINTHVQGQEHNQPQTKDENVALVYGLVVDNSGSLRSNLAQVIDAGKLIVNSQRAGDEAFIVRFVHSENIKTVQDFTSNQAALINSLDSIYVEGGRSSIIDAVYFSLQHISREGSVSSALGRALILITDGDERSSFYKLEQLLTLIREKSVKVYVIGLVQGIKLHGINSKERATTLLKRIADESGGRAFFPKTMTEIRNIASGILDDIRKQ